MRYTRTALGLLNAQYRSVLKKCFLINMGLFALGASVGTANAAVTLTPTLDTIKTAAEQDGAVSSEAYELTKLASGENLPEGVAAVKIGSDVYYFSPKDNQDAKLLSILAGTPVATVNDISNPTSITFDVANISSKFPSSVFGYAEGTENDYNFVVQEADQDGNITKKYYKVVLKTNEFGTSEAIKWSTDADGATGSVEVKFPNSDTPTKLYYTVDESKYNPTLGTRLTDLTADVGSATKKVLFKGLTSDSSSVYGGAINNSSNKGYNIYADFIGNYTSSSNSRYNYSQGGAIYNNEGIIGNITGDFIGNYASSASYYSQGGAIYNFGTIGDITGDFVGNYAFSSSAASNIGGGAIYNLRVLGNITGDFIGNYASSAASSTTQGGAIHNYGTIGNITGDFIGNYASSSQSYGGAIYNSGTIGNISGDFIGNHASFSISSYGGAIYNSGTIGNITGDFIGNYASATYSSTSYSNSSYGGAIYNLRVLGNITGDFIGNYASSAYSVYSRYSHTGGGAIYNHKETIGNITGDFIGNYASSSSSSSVYGGAIYNNYGTIGDISGDFIGNYASASSENGKAAGGAIYNHGTITLGGASEFIDNYIENNGNKESNAIHNEGTINFNSGKIVLNDAVSGNNGTLNLSGQTTATSDNDVISINNTVSGNTVILEKGTLKLGHYYSALFNDTFYGTLGSGVDFKISGNSTLTLIDDDVHPVHLRNMTLDSNVNYGIDLSLSNKNTDTFTTDSLNANNHKFVLKQINLVDDAEKHVTEITLDNHGGLINSLNEDEITITNGANLKNAYLAEVTGANKIKFGNIKALETAVQFKKAATDFALDEDTVIESNLGALQHEKLNVNGNGHTVDGAGFGGMSVANGQTVSLNDVNIKNFGGTFVTNKGDLSINNANMIHNGVQKDGGLRGGAIYNIGSTADISGISGNFENNYIISNNNNAFGGAIFNEDKATIGDISGKFIENFAETKFYDREGYVGAAGGAIANPSGTINNISGEFSGNYAKNTSGKGAATGGAIVNRDSGKINGINAVFSNNYAESLEGAADGGAIYNYDKASIGDISGKFSGNYASGKLWAYGGTIRNIDATIGNIIADFENNHAYSEEYAAGGAIYNSVSNSTSSIETSIKDIKGNFTNNYAQAVNRYAVGGAIYNSSASMGNIKGDFSGNYAQSEKSIADGGAIYNSSASMGNIKGDFSGNYAQSEKSIADGGAIYNYNSVLNDINGSFIGNYAKSKYDAANYFGSEGGAIYNGKTSIKNITGNFVDNYVEVAEGSSSAGGGAIYNRTSATIEKLQGNFENNYSKSEKNEAYGGAILNWNNSKIDEIKGDFSKNHVVSIESGARGGAIDNASSSIGNITGNFTGNYAQSENGQIRGGAIYNYSANDDLQINKIAGDFENNYVKSEKGQVLGGALFNQHSGIDEIEGNFIGNYATSVDNMSFAGAVLNAQGKINKITGNFTDNYIYSAKSNVNGGAINNNNSGKIGDISGNFNGNYAKSGGDSSLARGGAILNLGNISSIIGDFENNYALTSGTSAVGGAISNRVGSVVLHGIGKLAGNFTNNYAKTTGTGENAYAQGGAIHNAAQMNIDDIASSSFIDNYVNGADTKTDGGAIWNAGNITFSGASEFTGNYAEQGGTKRSNAIYNEGTINFNSGDIVLNDAVTGNGGVFNLAGQTTENSASDVITVNNQVSGNTVNLTQGLLKLGSYNSAEFGKSVGTFADDVNFVANGGALTTQDGETNDHNLGNLQLKENLNTAIDVDLANVKADTMTGSSKAVSSNGSKVLIENINIVADSSNHIIKIRVVDNNLKNSTALADNVTVAMNPADTNSYLIVYETDDLGGNLKFGNTKALETAVQFENANKVFAMGKDAVSDTDLGSLVGDKLTINGNNHTIDGAGFGGMTIANGQTVSLSDVTVKGFAGAFAENNGTLNIKSDTSTNLESAINGTGTINVNGGEFNLNSDITAGSVNMNNGNYNLNGNITADNMHVNGGEFNLDNGSELTEVNNFVADGGVLNVGDQTIKLKNATFNDGSIVKINVKDNGNGLLKADNLVINGGDLKASLGQGIVDLTNKQKIVTLLESGTDFTDNFASVADNNMYRFEKAEKAGDYIISLIKTAEDVSRENAGTENNANEAKAWIDGNKFAEGSISADLADNLADLAQNNAKAFNEALSALAPSDTPIVRTTSVNHSVESFSAVTSHLNENYQKNKIGLSSGDSYIYNGVSAWARALGNHTKVDDNSKSYGFSSDNYGVSLGVDKQLNTALKVGAGYSYFANDISGFMRDSDVDTHAGFVYVEYRPNNWYINAVASYGYSEYDETKHVAGNNYKGKFDVDNLGAQVMTGYNAKVAETDVTPEIGLRYNNIHRDDYVDDAGQAVKAETMDVMTAIADVKVGKDLVSCIGTRSFYWHPEARLAATYDFISDKENAAVTLPNGAGYFVNGQRLNRFGIEAGVGVTFYLTPRVESSVGYEGKFRKDYADHTGYVSAKYKF